MLHLTKIIISINRHFQSNKIVQYLLHYTLPFTNETMENSMSFLDYLKTGNTDSILLANNQYDNLIRSVCAFIFAAVRDESNIITFTDTEIIWYKDTKVVGNFSATKIGVTLLTSFRQAIQIILSADETMRKHLALSHSSAEKLTYKIV